MARGCLTPEAAAAGGVWPAVPGLPEGPQGTLCAGVGELQYGETAASRAAAARELRALASGPARRREIAAVGAIPALATLLKEGTVALLQGGPTPTPRREGLFFGGV